MPVYRLHDRTPTLHPECWVAPNATVIGTVDIQRNASLWWNVVARGDNDLITIGENTNIQEGSVLHTDPGLQLTLGANCLVGHMVMLHGCTIGDGSLIGIGSIVLNRAVIGKHSLVGANTLIPEGKSFPDGVMILGSPGKVVRELSAAEIESIQTGVNNYVLRWKRFAAGLAPV